MSSEIKLDYPQALPIERVVVLENPVGKNQHVGKRQLHDLIVFSDLPYETVITDPEPETTAERLARLEITDLLYVIGGDGTVNSAIIPALKAQPLILPTRSGNANDLAMSVNGKKEAWQIFADYMAGSARAVSVPPIEVNVDSHCDHQTRYALNYASFGYAALASLYINNSWQHDRLKGNIDKLPRRLQNLCRLVREGYLLGKAATEACLFEYQEGDPDQAEQVADISVVHSERMAKLGRFNVRHTDPFVFSSKITRLGAFEMGKQFIKMVNGKISGQNTTEVAFRANSLNDNPLYYQVDGEAYKLPDSSNIQAGLAAATLRILSTRL